MRLSNIPTYANVNVSNMWICNNSSTSLTDFSGSSNVVIVEANKSVYKLDDFGGILKLLAGVGEIYLPDNTKLVMDHLGNYKIIDDDAKIKYEANFNREFNKYVNASELLSEFVMDLGSVGVVQNKILKTPIEYFINWLIHKAAEADNDPYAKEGIPTLKDSRKLLPASQLRCKFCQRFLSKDHERHGMHFCNPIHMSRYADKIGLEF